MRKSTYIKFYALRKLDYCWSYFVFGWQCSQVFVYACFSADVQYRNIYEDPVFVFGPNYRKCLAKRAVTVTSLHYSTRVVRDVETGWRWTMLLSRPHCLISFLYLDGPEDKQDSGYTACAGTCICMSYFFYFTSLAMKYLMQHYSQSVCF